MRTIKLQEPSFLHLSFTKPFHAVGLSVDPYGMKHVIPSVSPPLEIPLLAAFVCSVWCSRHSLPVGVDNSLAVCYCWRLYDDEREG